MAVPQFSALWTSLATDTDVGGTWVEVDIGDTNDTVYALEADNTANSVKVYLKMAEKASSPSGSTPANWVLPVPALSRMPLVFNGGVGKKMETAGDNLWLLCVTGNGNNSGTTAPTNDVKVRVWHST